MPQPSVPMKLQEQQADLDMDLRNSLVNSKFMVHVHSNGGLINAPIYTDTYQTPHSEHRLHATSAM